MKYFQISILFYFLLLTISCDSSSKEPTQEQSIQTFLDEFLIAFNNTQIEKIDELSASPFVFYVGGKLSEGSSYGAIVDFEAIKKTGWKYIQITSYEIFFENELSSQIRLDFSRHNEKDEILVSSNVIWTLIKEKSKWKLKSAIILDNIPLAKED